MPYSMFCTANIHIYLPPVITCFSVAESFTIFGIHVAEEIPRGTCVTGDGRGFSFCRRNLTPGPSPRERGLSTVLFAQFFQSLVDIFFYFACILNYFLITESYDFISEFIQPFFSGDIKNFLLFFVMVITINFNDQLLL